MDNCNTQQWVSELEQQLEVAETRCGSLKSQLDYMKMLYQGIQPNTAELAKTMDRPQTQPNPISQTPPQKSPPPVELDPFEENPAAEDVKYYQFLKEIHKMQQMTKEIDEPVKKSPRQSSKSPRVSPRIADRYYTAPEENEGNLCADYRQSRQNKTRSKTYTLLEPQPSSIAAPIPTSIPIALPSSQVQEVCREHDIDDATALQHPYQQHLMEYSRCLKDDLVTAKELTIHSVAEGPGECIKPPLTPSKKGVKKEELVLKLSGSMDSARATKRKKLSKPEKKTKVPLYSGSTNKKSVNAKNDDTISVTSKIRRKRGKLRSTNSKSTVATKDTNLTDRKDPRKRKQKGIASASYTQVPRQSNIPLPRALHNWSEVVEIYHNNAAGGGSGSVSMSSSKHSRPEPRARESSNGNAALKKNEPKQMGVSDTLYQQQQKVLQQQQMSQQNQEACYQSPQSQTVARSLNQTNYEHPAYSSTCPAGQSYAIESYNAQQSQCKPTPSPPTGYYDPMVVRNYELPTVASKLKQVNRSYFNRFNFRNIPFVVGTSVTPSHNLGLNIQQVLSIMKTRQPMTSGITPLLIRKVSKGMKPVSTLLDRVNDQYQKLPKTGNISPEYTGSQLGATNNCGKYMAVMDESSAAKYAGYLPMQTPRLSNIPTTQTYYDIQQAYANTSNKNGQDPLYEEEEETPSETQWHQQQQSGCTCCPKKNISYNKMLKQFTSRKSIVGNPKLTPSALLRQRQEELNIGDGQYTQKSLSGNAKGIREVLINLHDQFEELNATYEKLQEQAEKSDDKSVTKQISALEKELNAKEEEINAVVGLYKEVLSLKQEVQTLHQKNSFVCVTTNEAPVSPIMIQSPLPVRTQTASPLQMFGVRKGPPSTSREPSTTTRLAGLLRQIQSFQKQLKLAS